MATITRYSVAPLQYRAEASIPNQFTGVASSATHTAVIEIAPGGPVTSDQGPVSTGLVFVTLGFSGGFNNQIAGGILGTPDRYFWDISINDMGMFTDTLSILAIAKLVGNPTLDIVASDALPPSGFFRIPITAFSISGFSQLQMSDELSRSAVEGRVEYDKLRRELTEMSAVTS